jgi:hypothetical protein
MVLFAAKFDPQQQAARSSAFLVSQENLRDALLTDLKGAKLKGAILTKTLMDKAEKEKNAEP